MTIDGAGSADAWPRFGLGGAALGNLYAPVTGADAADTLAAAFEGGIRYVDTAPYYGHGLSERRIGAALAAAPIPGVRVSTKVGRSLAQPGTAPSFDTGFVGADPFIPVFDYSREAVLRQLEASRSRLGRERFDIVFVHDIGRRTHGEAHSQTFRTAMDEALPALSELKSAGLVGEIGIGVNEIEVCLETLAAAEIDVILLAGRMTLLDQSGAETLLPECRRRGVRVIAGGPFNSGILAGGAHYDYMPAPPELAARARRIARICADHDVPVGAAALQFPLTNPAVSCVIAGARSAAEVRQNAALASQAVPPALWADLAEEARSCA